MILKAIKSELTIPIKGLKKELPNPPEPEHHILRQISASENITLEKDRVSVQIYSNTFYDDIALNFEVINDTLKLDKPIIPLTKTNSYQF